MPYNEDILINLTNALTLCQQRFEFYVEQHSKKGKVKKMLNNQLYAEMCKKALRGEKVSVEDVKTQD